MRTIDEVSLLFKYDHLPPHLAVPSRRFHDLALDIFNDGPDGAMVTKALNDLWQAKNWAIANIAQNGPQYLPK